MFLPTLWFVPIVLAYLAYQVVIKALPRFFLVPSELWQDKIRKVLNHPKPIYLSVGLKRSSYRRRLVTASVQPSYYTNFLNNKLKINPLDRDRENDAFMNAMKRRDPNDTGRKLIYGFFHPYANNGGGGEKVLWQAVQATLLEDPRNIVAIYTISDQEPLAIVGKACDKFDIRIDSSRVVFVYLRKYGKFIDANYWSHFTLIGQLLGSVVLAVEALFELSPDVWVDTMGLPGSYLPVNWILKVPIVAYVHYPIIQPDMFNKLKFQKLSSIAGVRSLADARQYAKLAYWSVMYYLYTYLGSCVDITFANGTWTYNHLKNIWFLNEGAGGKLDVLYPPCSTEVLTKKTDSSTRENTLLYIAQFRPEKRHLLILEEFRTFLDTFRTAKLPTSRLPTLIFLGSCRTPDDSYTLDSLREKVRELEISEYVEFVVDCSFEDVQKHLASAKFGLNAMWNEHFGIGVVEYASSGVVPIVHASAGPLLDILAVDGASESWQNEVAFFFKSETDPDFLGESDGELAFEHGGKRVLYPSLSQVLGKIYLESPELSSDAALESKRVLAAKLMLERFSNKLFVTRWMEYLRIASQLEAKYREDRRDKVELVY